MLLRRTASCITGYNNNEDDNNNNDDYRIRLVNSGLRIKRVNGVVIDEG